MGTFKRLSNIKLFHIVHFTGKYAQLNVFTVAFLFSVHVLCRYLFALNFFKIIENKILPKIKLNSIQHQYINLHLPITLPLSKKFTSENQFCPYNPLSLPCSYECIA